MRNAYNKLIEMIETVARALGDEMLKEVAFVGGATTGLLLTDEFSKEAVRYTDDVDLIINCVGFPKWVAFQERLRAKGFKESIEDDVNCCSGWNTAMAASSSTPTTRWATEW